MTFTQRPETLRGELLFKILRSLSPPGGVYPKGLQQKKGVCPSIGGF
jgi:hypothetical protein